MSLIDIILISIGLACDAFVASITIGLSYRKIPVKIPLLTSVTFSTFQVIMPLMGYLVAYNFNHQVTVLTKIISFVILTLIGLNMLLNKEESKVDIKNIMVLGLATSLDAFAVGLSLAFLEVNLLVSLISIGLITFLMCFVGPYLGNYFGTKILGKPQVVGGIILIVIGVKILIF